MAAYLELAAQGRVDTDKLTSAVHPLDMAGDAFEALQSGDSPPLLVLLHYPGDAAPDIRRVELSAPTSRRRGRLRMAIAGAGNFVCNLHLPNMERLEEQIEIAAVMSRTGHQAAEVARQFGAGYATTDFDELLNDADVDAVLIGSRHDSHAELALRALEAGKHVFVEKPLALNPEDLRTIRDFYTAAADGINPLLLTGYNRRFSPFAEKIRRIMASRTNPAIINYRLNAGHLPDDHWVQGPEGGGRNIGEACHVYDLFTYLTGARVRTVDAQSILPQTGFYR